MERRITIVDDEREVRCAVRRLLKAVGLDAEGFSSAEEFLDAPSTRRCDCLILDLRLPGMSGLELQSRLRAAHPKLPVIIVSARDDAGTRAQALQKGAFAFFGKPFGDEALLQAVRTALDKAGT